MRSSILWIAVLALACEGPGQDGDGNGDLVDPSEEEVSSADMPDGTAACLVDMDAESVECFSGFADGTGVRLSYYAGVDETYAFETNAPATELQDCGGFVYYMANYGTAPVEIWVSCALIDDLERTATVSFRVTADTNGDPQSQALMGRAVAIDSGEDDD